MPFKLTASKEWKRAGYDDRHNIMPCKTSRSFELVFVYQSAAPSCTRGAVTVRSTSSQPSFVQFLCCTLYNKTHPTDLCTTCAASLERDASTVIMASAKMLSDDYEKEGLTANTFLTQNSEEESSYSPELSQNIEAAAPPVVSSCEAPSEAKMISTQVLTFFLSFFLKNVFDRKTNPIFSKGISCSWFCLSHKPSPISYGNSECSRIHPLGLLDRHRLRHCT